MSAAKAASFRPAGPAGMLATLLLILLLRLSQSQADQITSKTCGPSVSTPGVTFPRGDIVLKEGKSLEIFCVLNLNDVNAKKHNASDLRFYRNNSLVEPEYLTIINETTLRYFVESPPASDSMYYCKLKPRNGADEIPVCLNKVLIGYEPQDVDNFKCLSYNWVNLNCTWTPRYNPVPTFYQLSFRLSGSPQSLFRCPNKTDVNHNFCLWDEATIPPYRQVYPHYYFIFNAENSLGKRHIPMDRFDHYKNIIPAKPQDFRVVNKTSSSFFLEWRIPYPLDSWAVNNRLDQKISYAFIGAKEEGGGKDEPWNVAFLDRLDCSRPPDLKCVYNLTGLQYPHVLYDVRVSLKTHDAPEEHWSAPAATVQRTAPAIPPAPPRTDIGSFEVYGRLPNRDVTIYWQSLPEKLHGGDGFTYKIVEVLQNGVNVPIKANFTGKKSASFNNVSLEDNFLFRIASANEVGLSPSTSEVYIPGLNETLRGPRLFTKTSFNNGTFKLTWSKPERHADRIKSYTIFWCDSQNDRPDTCTGFLNWTHVDSTQWVVTLQLRPIMYHFAISANSDRASSGMVWASCSMVADKVDKLKTVEVKTFDATSMELEWKFDCVDADNIVRGFKIFYCVARDKEGQHCKDLEKNITIDGDHTTTSAKITGLQPYVTYKASVAIVAKMGAGLKSDPVFCTLNEAAPSSPPTNIQVSNITNSSMVVSWSAPPSPNGVLRYYEVYYNNEMIKRLVDNPIDESARNQEQVVLKKLVSYTNYSISIKACTKACSDKSDPIIAQTLIGVPGLISRPETKFLNSSQVIVSWRPPVPQGGRLDYYLMLMEQNPIDSDSEPKFHIFNVSNTEYQIAIPDCNNGGGPLFKFSVRGVNIDGDKEFMGPWSEPEEGRCYEGQSKLEIFYISLGVVSAFMLLVTVAVYTRRMYTNCREMSDVAVKIPTGILPPDTKDPDFNMTWATHGRDTDDPSGKTRPAADKERLLQRKDDRHERNLSGESSGCSSGHDTVSSSTTSGTQISTDSGTEIDQHEQGFPDPSAMWQNGTDSAGLPKRNNVQPGCDSYVHVGSPKANNDEITDVKDKMSAGFPTNLGIANWLPSNYVAMTGKEAILGSKVNEPITVAPAVISPTKPPIASRGYVAHNAPIPIPIPNTSPWSNPPFSDSYVQMGSFQMDQDEGLVDPSEKEELHESDVQVESQCPEEIEEQPIVLRPLSKSLSGIVSGEECDSDRTTAEVPLVPPRTGSGYVSHSFQPKPSPVLRHEYVRTAEKNPSLLKSDATKPYTRLGEREPRSFVRPETVAPSTGPVTSGYVPHRQFETRATPSVVRE